VQLALPEAFLAAGDRVDLDAGDQLEPCRHAVRRAELAVRRQGIVIGDREQANPGLGRLADELERLEDAVGATGMGVQVDRRRPGRDDRVPDGLFRVSGVRH
jgi:hypothetical protein